jgi:hypothetical protein
MIDRDKVPNPNGTGSRTERAAARKGHGAGVCYKRPDLKFVFVSTLFQVTNPLSV